MQSPIGFVGSCTWKLAAGKSSLSKCHCSEFNFSQYAKVDLAQPPPRGALAIPGHPRRRVNQSLRDFRSGFELRHTANRNRNNFEFLRYTPPVSKMNSNDTRDWPSPAMSDLSVSEKLYKQALRLSRTANQTRSSEDFEVVERLIRQTGVTGSVKRRNAFYLGIPHKYLRAHEAFHALPTSLNVQIHTCESLTSMRQDCEPFLAAWQRLPLRANEVWPLLGFGEPNPIALLLPPQCRGHAHALKAWRRLFSPTVRVKKRSFNQRFVHEHVGNATLSYILAEQTRWHHLVRTAPPWCEAVQLLETGCHVSNLGQIPLATAPVARVTRRNKADFWMWGPIDTILIAKTEHMYSQSSHGKCRLKRPEVRRELDLLSWIEAQFSMLCCGESIRFTDVVWYATLGGFSVFRIRRDDAFLQAGLQGLERFIVQYVDAGFPPPSGFERGSHFSCMTERIKNRSETIDKLSHEYAHIVETRLMPWRRRLNDWELKRSQDPFFFLHN